MPLSIQFCDISYLLSIIIFLKFIQNSVDSFDKFRTHFKNFATKNQIEFRYEVRDYLIDHLRGHQIIECEDHTIRTTIKVY